MWQFGHAAETACRSNAISTPQSGSPCGSGFVAPRWLTLRKHLFATVHAGRSNCFRYVARSEAVFGLSYASTIAMVWPDPLLIGSLYAAAICAGVRPVGLLACGSARC